jgi:general nucleoside transport system ATP-binding protein
MDTTMTTVPAPLVELIDIVKTFPGVRANDGVSFSVLAGEIHGLLGENGAGKSTLMSILYGLYQPDEGRILRRGEEISVPSPRAALDAGIAIVQQHFALVPNLSVAENVILGLEPSRLLRRARVNQAVRELIERYRFELDPTTKVGALSIGQRQRVEILKCLYRQPEVIIFDEPTTVLIPQEITDLFNVLRDLAAEGRGIVLITHKLDELLAVTDRVTVLRHGRSEGTVGTAEVDGATLARLMVGREVRLRSTATLVGLVDTTTEASSALDAAPIDAHADAPTILALHNVGAMVDGVDRLQELTLNVRAGEIVGIAGVEGNGQRELVEILCGTRRATSGTVHVGQRDITGAGPLNIAAAGVRVITEDRHMTGCVLDMTVGENLLSDRIGEAPYSRRGVISKAATSAAARTLIADYRVKTPGPEVLIRSLSGGNQQRAILARELSRPVIVLVAAQPTRGLDVGAIEEVTDRIQAVRAEGAGVLLVSSDLAEVFALSDRIAVLYRGRIVGVLARHEATAPRVGALMAGLSDPGPTSNVAVGA